MKRASEIIEPHEIQNALEIVERASWKEQGNGLTDIARLDEANRWLLNLREGWALLSVRVEFAIARAEVAIKEIERRLDER